VAGARGSQARRAEAPPPASGSAQSQFTYSLALNWFEPDNGDSQVSLTPALRSRIHGSLFLLTGVEFPINDDANYDQRWIVQLVRGF
jgi:hypothetical protein